MDGRWALDTWDELWSPRPMKMESNNQEMRVSFQGACLRSRAFPLCLTPPPSHFLPLPAFFLSSSLSLHPSFFPSPELDLASRTAMVPATHAASHLFFIFPSLLNLPTPTLSPSPATIKLLWHTRSF